MINLAHAFREGEMVYVTDVGIIAISEQDMAAAGVRRTKNGGVYRNKRGRILHDFLSLYALDEYLG